MSSCSWTESKLPPGGQAPLWSHITPGEAAEDEVQEAVVVTVGIAQGAAGRHVGR